MTVSTSADAPMLESFIEHPIVEGSATEAGDRREVWIDLIREGFGNARDGHYYSRRLLESEAERFRGAKMFANHLDPEAVAALKGYPRAIQDVQGRILETQYVSDRGDGRATIRGRVNVLQDWLWNMVKRDPGILGVSINARGASTTGVAEGKADAKIVESISHVNSVDWVTEAGAGGQVVAFVEAAVQAEEEGMAADRIIEDGPTDPPPAAGGTSQPGTTPGPQPKSDDAAPGATPGVTPGTPSTDRPAVTDADEENPDDDDEDDATESEWIDLDANPIREGEGYDDDSTLASFDAALWGDDLTEAETDIGGHDPMPVGRYGGVRDRGDLDNPGGPANNRGRVDPHATADVFEGFNAGAAYSTLIAAVEAGTLDETEVVALADALDDAGAGVDFEEAAEQGYQRAKAEFDQALELEQAAHAEALEAVRQRTKAADLPAASKRALLEQFHDFIASDELADDGALVRSTMEVLEAEVDRAVGDKRAELAEFTEAHIDGAGDSAGSLTEAGGQEPSAGATARGPQLDDEIDRELFPEQRMPR
jgi:hypothetical protein